MATRTIPLSSESYTTDGEGEWVAFYPDYNNEAFGSNRTPTSYSISFDHTYLYANYSGNVTMKWDLDFKIGGSWYTVYSGSKSMSKSNSNFNSSGSLSSTVANAFKNGSITEVAVTQTGSRVIKGSSSGSGTLTITYDEVQPTITTPSISSITQNNDGTFTIKWNACTGSNGSGSVYYGVYDDTAGGYLRDIYDNPITATSYTGSIPAYGTTREYSIIARYSGVLSSWSSIKSTTFTKPSITAPSGLKVTSATAQTCALSWTAAKLNYTSGTITYSIRRNGTEIATTTSTSYTVAEATTKGWGTSASTMTVVAKGTSLGNTASGTTLTSSATSGVSYTYRAAVTTNPSNLKINSGTTYTGATAPLTWSAAAFSGGQTPTYSIRVDGTQIATTTSTSYTIPESTTKSYTSAKTITIVATGGGATSSATSGVTYTYSPTITAASNLKIKSAASYTGRTAPLTWTAGSLSNGATVTYSLRKGGTEFATTTSTSYTVAESVTKGWGTSAVKLTVVATGSGKTSSASNEVTYTYQPAFTANPSGLKINGGSSYTGQTAPLTWTAATISNGATITYTIYNGSTSVGTTTSTSYTIPETTTKSWTSAVTLTVKASASGITSGATSGVTYTYSPAITAPSNLKINGGTSFTGQTAPLTWTAGSLSNGATVTYSLRKGGVQFATTTNTSYTVPESVVSTWGTSAVTITVVATGSGKTSSASNGVTFTYKPPFKTVKYHNGTAWVECIAYYHDGTRWVKCDLYYHNGTKWNLSDH